MKWLLIVLLLTGCSTISKLPLGGGGVNTNAQVGQENTQQVVAQQNSVEEHIKIEGDQTNTQEVGVINVKNEEVPLWVILLAILGWMLPSPSEIWKGFLRLLPWVK